MRIRLEKVPDVVFGIMFFKHDMEICIAKYSISIYTTKYYLEAFGDLVDDVEKSKIIMWEPE